MSRGDRSMISKEEEELENKMRNVMGQTIDLD